MAGTASLFVTMVSLWMREESFSPRLLLLMKMLRFAGAWKAEAFSHYFGIEKDWELIKSIDLEDYQLPNGTRPLAGVDLGVHRTVRLLACRVPPTLLN